MPARRPSAPQLSRQFALSGRPADRNAATAAAATLAAMTDGVLFDTEPGHFISADSALAWARNERYQPIATSHRRALRRKARLTPPIILRLLIIAVPGGRDLLAQEIAARCTGGSCSCWIPIVERRPRNCALACFAL